MDSISLLFVVPGNIYTRPIDGIAKDRKLWRGDQRKKQNYRVWMKESLNSFMVEYRYFLKVYNYDFFFYCQ